jgi:hypothetical protein
MSLPKVIIFGCVKQPTIKKFTSTKFETSFVSLELVTDEFLVADLLMCIGPLDCISRMKQELRDKTADLFFLTVHDNGDYEITYGESPKIIGTGFSKTCLRDDPEATDKIYEDLLKHKTCA